MLYRIEVQPEINFTHDYWIICSRLKKLFSNMHIVQKEFWIDKNVTSWIEIKNRNLTRQNFDYSCGLASLSTILKYFYNQMKTMSI